MNKQTLLQIKTELKALAKVYEDLVKHWNGKLEHGNNAKYPITVTISVTLGNMAGISTNCYDYNHDKDVQELYDGLEILRSLDNYNKKCYMSHFPCTEADMIITGLVMAEEDISESQDIDDLINNFL